MSESKEAVELSEEQIEEVNSAVTYTMYSVFRQRDSLANDREQAERTAREFFDSLAADGSVTVRALVDVAGLRADADFMVWWHSPSIDDLQAAYRGLLATDLGAHLDGVWSNAGVHRPAEFNRSHVPNFLADPQTRGYLCVYPFVRSYDWYTLPEEDRSRMLREHGMAAAGYADVRANTVASFALGDYEWLLAFEADELHRIVDLMRDLRAVEARHYTREEIPFYTGPVVSLDDLLGRLR